MKMIPKWIEKDGKVYLYKGYRTGRDNAYRRMRDLRWNSPKLDSVRICADDRSSFYSKYYIYARPHGDD